MSRSFKRDPEMGGRKSHDFRRAARNKKYQNKQELANNSVRLDSIERRKFYRNEEQFYED
jgi:hypothetical protein